MRYHIQTAPIWDAFKEKDDCPLCKLYARVEERIVGRYLDESVMMPEVRVKVNERGFCTRHLTQLYNGNSRLGLALQLNTRTENVINDMKMVDNAKQAKKLAEKLNKTLETCVICDEADEIMERYAYTVAQMFANEAEFPEVFNDSFGFCLPHYIELLKYVSHAGSKAGEYAQALSAKEIDTTRKINATLERFTKRFDYRSKDGGGGKTDDAVALSINRLKGRTVK